MIKVNNQKCLSQQHYLGTNTNLINELLESLLDLLYSSRHIPTAYLELQHLFVLLSPIVTRNDTINRLLAPFSQPLLDSLNSLQIPLLAVPIGLINPAGGITAL